MGKLLEKQKEIHIEINCTNNRRPTGKPTRFCF